MERGADLPTWRHDPPPAPFPLQEDGYGIVLPDGPHPCSREEMVEWIRAHPGIPAVWTPETGSAKRPEELPFLVEALRSRRAEEAQQRLGLASLGGLVVAGGFLLSGWRPGAPANPGALVVAVLVGFWLLDSVYRLHRVRRLDGNAFPLQRQNERHAAWMHARSAPWTRVVGVALVLVFAMEGAGVDRAVAVAGLVKERAWAGEWWRLLTGPVLHGGLPHLLMNVAALEVLGRFVEVHTSRFRMATVFLVSALAGSVFSLVLTPVASVGASGGIMGLVGYLGTRAGRRPAEFPDDFLHRVRYAVGATAVLGVLGFAFVDNWAHLGGLLAGAALGWLGDDEAGEEGPRSVLLGRFSMAAVLLACAWAIARLAGLAPAAG